MARALLTLLLAAVAVGAAAGVGYGTDPRLAERPGGVDLILLGRRLQWPLATVSVLASVGVIAVVVGGRARGRVAWLLVLAPVLWLFHHRFAGEPWRRLAVAEAPPFVSAAKATFLKDDALVFGVVFEGSAYAYPAAALARTPVVVHADADRRLIVMASPHAGRVTAAAVDHTVRARELDVVSMPAGALLLYNARVGQFVNAFTGLTPDGKRPAGFGRPVDVDRTTWRAWRTAHPDTDVLATARADVTEPAPALAFPTPPGGWAGADPRDRVALTATTRPAAIRHADVPAGSLFNFTSPGLNGLAVADPAAPGQLRVYDRAIRGDLFPRFAPRRVTKKPDVALVDSETKSLWTIDGRCVEGTEKGTRLRPVRVEQGVVWGTTHVFLPGVAIAR